MTLRADDTPLPLAPGRRTNGHRTAMRIVRPDDHAGLPRREMSLAMPMPRRTIYNTTCKPAIDRTVALIAIVATAPIMLAAALAIRLTMGNPVFFRQRRVGLGGRTFDVLKFRTMETDRRQAQKPFDSHFDRRLTHKSGDDPRHTAVGRFLRKWSIDELPQLFNVLNGDMSVVGPRPELVEIVSAYDDHVHDRHRVKPGITGLWQVGARGDGLMHENPDLDLEYVERQSFSLDLRIMLLTPAAALGAQKGA